MPVINAPLHTLTSEFIDHELLCSSQSDISFNPMGDVLIASTQMSTTKNSTGNASGAVRCLFVEPSSTKSFHNNSVQLLYESVRLATPSLDQVLVESLLKKKRKADEDRPPARKRARNQAAIKTNDELYEEMLQEKELEKEEQKKKERNEKRGKKQQPIESKKKAPPPPKDLSSDSTPLSSPEKMELNDSTEISETEDDGDDEHGISVDFIPRRYSRIKENITEGQYYGVDYGRHLCYIGRVLKVGKTGVTCKFLRRTERDKYDWPVRDDVDTELEPEGFFIGPLKLKGTIPFTIRNVLRAHQAFREFVSQQELQD